MSKFSSRFLFLSGRCLPFFKHTQKIDDICWIYGKPQTGQVKFKISPGTGEAKFSLGETGKKFNVSGFTGSVTEEGIYAWYFG